MASIGYQLKRMCETHGHRKFGEVFAQALTEKKIDPYAIRIPDLTRHFLGEDYFAAESKLKALASNQTHLLESSDANDASAFSNITGQLLVTIVKEKYQSPDFITDRLVRTIPNPGANLKEHKVPYLSDVDTEPAKLAQLEPYPMTKFAESWVTLPAPEKFGHICAVSMEMAFSDLTGQAQDSASSIGRSMGYNREKRRLRPILGITNPYKWNDNSLNTYVGTAGTGNYVNRLGSTTIVNFTQINTMEQLFWRMVDPITGRSIYVRPKQLLCAPEKRYELKRILNAVETRSGDITTGTGDQVVAPNPLEINYEVLSSPIARSLLADEGGLNATEIRERVYYGDFQRAFVYREVYPMQVTQAPALNPLEFNQDIVVAVKCSEFGVAGVYDPRHAGLSTSEA